MELNELKLTFSENWEKINIINEGIFMMINNWFKICNYYSHCERNMKYI